MEPPKADPAQTDQAPKNVLLVEHDLFEKPVSASRLFGIMLYENRIVDNRFRPSTVASSVGPHASKNCTSCLRAPSSFHLRSRLTISSSRLVASVRSPLALSAMARSNRA